MEESERSICKFNSILIQFHLSVKKYFSLCILNYSKLVYSRLVGKILENLDCNFELNVKGNNNSLTPSQ